MVSPILVVCLICILGAQAAPRPPKEPKIAPPAPPPSQKGAEMDDLLALEYQRYLHEVVSHLESDPAFKKKLETADAEYIKSGKISDHLDNVPYEIRTKLDEAKNKEVERLRELIKRQVEIEGPNNIQIPEHIDHINLGNFGKEDLRKLIVKTTKDLDDIDRRRKDEFKEYEEKKEAEWRHYLAGLSEPDRQKAIADHAALLEKHKKHPDLKHPGSEDQLKDVWEDEGLDPDQFDPKTFFSLHDLNGDGYWDSQEVEALFQKELDKMYNETDSKEDDPFEREEEMNRMREHVVKEMDKNQDHFISLDEFLQDTKDPQFDNKEEWNTLDEDKQYTEEEMRQYEKQLAMKNGWGEPVYQPGQAYPTYTPGGHPTQPQGGHAQQAQQQYQVDNNQVHGGAQQMQQQGHLGHEVPVGNAADELMHNDNTVNHGGNADDVVKQQQEIRRKQHEQQAEHERQQQHQQQQQQQQHGQPQQQQQQQHGQPQQQQQQHGQPQQQQQQHEQQQQQIHH